MKDDIKKLKSVAKNLLDTIKAVMIKAIRRGDVISAYIWKTHMTVT